MKKLLAALAAALLILPFQGAASAASPGWDETAVREAVPVLHGALLAMTAQGTDRFDPADEALVWEALYGALSLAAQEDGSAACLEEDLLVTGEQAARTAAVLAPGLSLDAPPQALSDRLTLLPGGDLRLVPGEDGLAEVEIRSTRQEGDRLVLTGALVYLPEESDLTAFTAVLQPRDSAAGFSLMSLELP